MLALLTIWTLFCVSTQTALCGVARGPSSGGDPQGNGVTVAPSLRKLLIAGGQDAPEGRFPYACSLRTVDSQMHRCGGTLIAPDWVLIAAHCLTGDPSLGPTPVVHVGAFKTDDDSSAEVILAVEVVIHESYTGNVEDGFDIALLRLEEPSNKQPVAVAQRGQRLGEGQFLATAGWGKSSNRGPLPKVLQLADQVAYVRNKNCRKRWPDLKETMLCAFSNSQGICEGDSGGPLLIADSKEGGISAGYPALDVLVGIVSFGPEGCNSTRPDVYTRVSSFRKWMDEKMGKSRPKPPPTRKCVSNCGQLDVDLIIAAGAGAANEVKELISQGADVSSTNGDLENTPLHFAATLGRVDVVEILIEAGAEVDVQDGEGITALYRAAQEGRLDVVKFLVKAGATVDLKADTGDTPLIAAAAANNLDVAEFLLESGASIDAQNEEGRTALYFAAQNGLLDVVKLLVKAGATVDLKTDEGATPLRIASRTNRVEVAEFLLESGADVNARTVGDVTPLHAAAFVENPKLVRLLLDNGAEVDAQDEGGMAALILAAHEGHLDVAKFLVEAGATVDLKSEVGDTPLIFAAFQNNLDVAEFLLESGANVHARNNQGFTPLHLAAYAGNPKLIRFLLDNGADIAAQDDFERTPIFWASIYGSGEAIEVLKNAGADLSIKSKNGDKIEDVICLCLEIEPPNLVCREGTCGEGETERIEAILKG